jgi:23S rRNA (guanosine2251-2'-O)-methyltransferase
MAFEKKNDNRERYGSKTREFNRDRDRREKPVDREDDGKKKVSERDDLIIGRNAAKEALKSGRAIDCVFAEKGDKNGALLPILAQCREKKLPIKEVDTKKLDFMCGHANHQGIVMTAAAHEYSTVEDILASAKEKDEPPFIIICDGIEDPHNLGAIIRSAECCGAHGVIIPERHSAGLSGIVGKTSAGALEYMPVARVRNLTDTIKSLKKEGIWVYCADMDGTPYREANLSGAIALVVGSEGSGVSRLVKENCDGTLLIPMKGNINSLNASVAAAILMFEAAAAR